MALGALGCMNNAEFEKKKNVNDNIVLDVFIICQKLRQVNLKYNIKFVLKSLIFYARTCKSFPT